MILMLSMLSELNLLMTLSRSTRAGNQKPPSDWVTIWPKWKPSMRGSPTRGERRWISTPIALLDFASKSERFDGLTAAASGPETLPVPGDGEGSLGGLVVSLPKPRS